MTVERGRVLPGSDRLCQLAERFTQELAGVDGFAELTVVVDRCVSPVVADWFWSFTFEHAGDYVQALWNGESEFLFFEDEGDYFEDVVPFDDVRDRVLGVLGK